MAFENYTIRQFQDALYKDDRSIMNEEIFKTVYTEYIDVAGLFATEEFDKVGSIHYLTNRINSIKIAIRLQREFLNNFEVPYIPGLKFFSKFGYNVYWNNKEHLETEFKKIERKEIRYTSQLENTIKELIDLRAKKNSQEKTVQQSRGSFIRTINSLGKIGYKVDMDKTTVEELAYMIKQQTEEVQEYKNR